MRTCTCLDPNDAIALSVMFSIDDIVSRSEIKISNRRNANGANITLSTKEIFPLKFLYTWGFCVVNPLVELFENQLICVSWNSKKKIVRNDPSFDAPSK